MKSRIKVHPHNVFQDAIPFPFGTTENKMFLGEKKDKQKKPVHTPVNEFKRR
jgi:hypothetical protein